jgi:hypothetical protein
MDFPSERQVFAPLGRDNQQTNSLSGKFRQDV